MKAASKQNIEKIASLMKMRRIALELKQSEAALRAGVTLGTMRKFEQTGEISLERFLRLCRVYRMDLPLMNFLEQRDFWAMEEIKRAETKKTVR